MELNESLYACFARKKHKLITQCRMCRIFFTNVNTNSLK